MSKLSVAQILECRKSHDEGKRLAWCRSCDRFKLFPCNEKGFYEYGKDSRQAFDKLVLKAQQKRFERSLRRDSD
jgi:hypothetical protein